MILLSIYDITQGQACVLIALYLTVVIGGPLACIYAAYRAIKRIINWH